MTTPESCSENVEPISTVDRVIHEPARLMIMTQLYVVESGDFTFLLRQTGLTWGNLSSHLSKLETAGYVEIQKEFVDRKPRTMLRLTEEGRAAFRQYRRSIQRMFMNIPD